MRDSGTQDFLPASAPRLHGPVTSTPSPHADLVARDFVVDGPNELRRTDIAELAHAGKERCIVPRIDTYPLRIVGWSIDNNIRTALVVYVLGVAIADFDSDHIPRS